MEPRRTDTPAPGSAATGRAGAGYRVETSGRVLLPEVLEEQLVPVMREELTGRDGRFDGAPASGLVDVAAAVGVRAVRDGDHMLLVTDRDGDTSWTEQRGAFFAVLARDVTEGEVRLRGEDGAEWSIRYDATGAQQQGVNGYDGSTALPPLRSAGTPAPPPVLPPVPEPPPEPSPEPSPEPAGRPTTEPVPEASPDPMIDPEAAQPPPEWAAPGWPPATEPSAFPSDEPAPRSPARTFGMAVLFLGGVFMILMIAIVASGLG